MSALFSARDSVINIEVGDYERFPEAQPEDAAKERSPKKFRHLSVVLVSFGILCVLQSILNITLRLAISTDEGEIEEEKVCPQGWITFDSSCYYISSRRSSWDDSRMDCVQRDADLVIINSRQEQAFLTGFTQAAWVGMTDRKEEGTWIWVDGTPVDKRRLVWARGQPDGAFRGEDCGDIRTMIDFIGLNDYDCKTRSNWICEKSLL